jgi:hypothetical protein
MTLLLGLVRVMGSSPVQAYCLTKEGTVRKGRKEGRTKGKTKTQKK